MNQWFYEVILTYLFIILLNHQNVISAQTFPTTSSLLSPTPFSIPPNGIQFFPGQVSLQEPLEFAVEVDSGSLNNIFISFCQRDVQNGIYGVPILNALINGKIYLSISQVQNIYRQTLCISLNNRANGGNEGAALYDLTTTIQAGPSGVIGGIAATQGDMSVQTTTATVAIPTTSSVLSNQHFSIPTNGVQNFTSQVSLQEPLEILVQVDLGNINSMYVSFCQRDVQNGKYGYPITNALIYGKIELSKDQIQDVYRNTLCISRNDRANDGINTTTYPLTTTIQAGVSGVTGSISASQSEYVPQTTTAIAGTWSVLPPTPLLLSPNGVISYPSQVLVSVDVPLEYAVLVDSGSIYNVYVSFCLRDVQNGIYGYPITSALINGKIFISREQLQEIFGNTFNYQSLIDRADGGIERATSYSFFTTIQAGANGVVGSISAIQGDGVPDPGTTAVSISTTSSALNQPFSTAPYGVNSFTCDISLVQLVDFSVKVTEGMIGRMYASFCLREVHDGNYGVAIQNMIISTNFDIQPSRMVEIYRKTFCPSESRRADGSIDKSELYELSITIIGGPIGASGEIAVSQS